MLPTNSNYTKEGCSPTSSNCVVWQGPDIDCINLCKGDSITDVTFNLATELCDVLTLLDISTYELGCIVPENPEPEDLRALLELIVSKVCALEAVEAPTGGTGGTGDCDCDISLAPCLQYVDGLGDPVTVLPLNEYVTLIGNTLCTNITIINANSATIIDHETRIDTLETAGGVGTFNTLRYGNGTPSAGTGDDGDFYIDISNDLIFGPKVSGAWPSGTSIVGPSGGNGTNGTDGINGLDGVSIVSTVDNGNGTFTFTYSDASFFTTSDLTGPTGATGTAGTNGTDGTNGHKIRFGSGVPALIAEDNVGDVYFDMSVTPVEAYQVDGSGLNWVSQGLFN